MPRDISDISASQGGVWTTAQAIAYGFSPDAIVAQLHSGRWDRVFRGAYAEGGTGTGLTSRVRAAMLLCGGRLAAARSTAAALHGLPVGDDVVHLVGTPETDRVPRSGLVVHRSCLGPGDVVQVDGLPCTSLARTAADLARTSTRLDALPVLDAALSMGLARQAITDELARHVGLRGVVQARDLLQLADGRAESPMESRMRLRAVDGGLPMPQLQVPVVINGFVRFRLDIGWDEYQVGGEYDGAVHLSRERQRYDLDRRMELEAAGWLVTWVTDVHVYGNWLTMVDRLRRQLLSRGWRPTPYDRHRAAS